MNLRFLTSPVLVRAPSKPVSWLETPPFKGKIRLAQAIEDWDDLKPKPGGDLLFRLIRQEKVGGAFWRPAPHFGDIKHIVLLPSDVDQARALWARVALQTCDEAKLAVGPFSVVDDGLLTDIVRNNGHYIERDFDIHSLLGNGVAIWASKIDALCILGMVYDTPVFLWPIEDEEPARADPQRAHALLVDGTQYFCPFTGKPSDAQAAINFLGDWRRIIDDNRKVTVCVGMAWWKRTRMRQFLENDRPLAFRNNARAAVALAARQGGDVAVWSSRVPHGLKRQAEAAGVGIRLVEDGFIRSVGLGSDLLPPSSIVIDSRGMYFDPSQPSDLEVILATWRSDETVLKRARALVTLLIERRVTKYGAGIAKNVSDVVAAPNQTIILVPGQVGDDLSIRLGAAQAGGNLGLLKRVRKENPDALIIYRPHPDVDAGHRSGAIPDEIALQYAQRIGRGGSMTQWIETADEIHTLTSLAGFEALLRRRRVVTYGQPFYAGWGLTDDRAAPVKRRGRNCTIDELVAATLIRYPRYLDPVTNLPCGPEILITRLEEASLWHPTFTMRVRQLQGRIRRQMASLHGVRQTN